MSTHFFKQLRLSTALCSALCALSFGANFAHAQEIGRAHV